MRIHRAENVYDAAKRRIRWLFEEFDGNIIVNHSGGKDSTVIFNLALEVARETGAGRVMTCFLDSEAEWQTTIDHMRHDVMYRDDVEAAWLQIESKLYLGASGHEWFQAWDKAAREHWMYDQQPIALTGRFGDAERFMDLFPAYARRRFPNERCAKIIGIRAEESPARTFGVTSREVYKGETWGAVENRELGHYTFSPIYDWMFSDVWHYIGANGLAYNPLYDLYWRFGFPRNNMRVADLTSGDMSRNSLILAELEPQTYAKLQARLGPEAMYRMETRGWFPDRLPPMFGDWLEYRDYLLDHLIADEAMRVKMRARFDRGLERFHPSTHRGMIHAQIGAVLVGDWKGVKQADFEAAHPKERLTNEAN